MAEEEPFGDSEEMEPTQLPLKGPNVKSTLDMPPSPDALRAQDAAIRKHLKGPPPDQQRPEG